MTSNIGSQLILDFTKNGDENAYEKMRKSVLSAMRAAFKPEFLNRVDDIVVFHALDITHLKQIVDIQIARLQKRLDERHIKLAMTDEAKEFLVKNGYDASYGARPLKRAIQREIETPLGRDLLRGNVKDHQTVVVSVEGDRLSFLGLAEDAFFSGKRSVANA
jgi:ATP-dependent Clp protease ATP-binding subunit ClpB